MFMKCTRCNKDIPDNESYFSGNIVPACCKDGTRKFGFAPRSIFCEGCLKEMEKFFLRTGINDKYFK